MPNFLNVQPSPSALVQSLCDIGYSMESAIADVIDNSITADTKNIHANFAWNKENPWIAVLDDGSGMTPAELTEAMRLGSKNPLEDRSKDDLGRFGLGLKIASFSQCRQLTLVSRKDGILACKDTIINFVRMVVSNQYNNETVSEQGILQITKRLSISL